ncbi:MAG: hypothetical protein LUD07_11905 [Clostridiales bacterium]|nr:hypothetical protein [Clostridiales bacterium]
MSRDHELGLRPGRSGEHCIRIPAICNLKAAAGTQWRTWCRDGSAVMRENRDHV